MKALKSLISAILIMAFIPSVFFAQVQGISKIVSRSPYNVTVWFSAVSGCNNGSSYTRSSGSTTVGENAYQTYDSQLKCYSNYTNIWCSAAQFSFSLPSNSILKKVEVAVSANYSGEIVELPTNIFSYSDSDFMSEIDNASSIFDFPHDGYVDITNYASQFLTNGSFYVGARSSQNQQSISITCQITYEIPAHVSFQNNMGGQFSVNSANKSGSFSDDYWLNTNISLSLNEPQYTTNPNYTWIWNDTEVPSNPSKWEKIKNGNVISSRTDQSFSFAVTSDDDQATYKANMKKKCNVTFQNSLPEGGNTGSIVVDGTSYPVTKTVEKVEGDSVSFASTSQNVINGVYSIFDHWAGGSTSSSREETINAHTTYTAYYKAKPSLTNRYLTISTTIGQPVTLNWNEHPSSNVTQYKIYRKVRPSGGTTGPEILIATINNMGTTTYVDNDYFVSNLFYYQLYYDVRYVYSGQCDGVNYTTESDASYLSTFGDTNMGQVDNKVAQQKQVKEIPEGYAVANYPNPFNPTTVINYQLPKDGMVTLKVYDVLGKEVATLVNDNRSAGYYSVEFNASNLPSGIYIYTITSNHFIQSKKMLLMK